MSKPDAERQFLALFDAIVAHGQQEYPREACGLMVKERRGTRSRVVYVPCRNIAPADAAADAFQVHPEDLAAAEELGELLALVHTHPDGDAHPSETDRVHCHASGMVWYIVAIPGGAWKRLEPLELPLLGRRFEHGTVDCYSLVRDYYRQRAQLELPDFPRADGWWERRADQAPQNLYREGFTAAGFIDLGPPVPGLEIKLHDVLLMRIGAEVENHAAVFVGMDGEPFGPMILQHLYGRLSGRDIWGGEWLTHTTAVLRHRSLVNLAGAA